MRERMLRIWRRWANLGRRTELDRELAQELEFHRAMKQQEKEQAGLDSRSASDAATREMGNVTRAKEDSREAWMFLLLETVFSDVRFASRVLLKTPLFTACAVLTLALGIGANTAIFTLIDALLLRGLPVPQPERIVQLTLNGDETMTSLTYPLYVDVSERAHSFAGLFSWNTADLWTGWGAQARHVIGAAASGNAYQTLGVVPQAGRLFVPGDDASGAAPVAVISDRFWAREFNRNPKAVGGTILLNRQPCTIIGVTRSNFLGVIAGTNPDVTITVHQNAVLHPSWHILDSKTSWYISIVGRLKPGVSEAQVRAELAAISGAVMSDQATETNPNQSKHFRAQKLDFIPGAAGGSWLARQYRKSLLLLMAISGLVLLLACVNLASLSLSRAASRQRELSVRLALGAARKRLIRQLLTESVVVSTAGAALGVAFAFWATRGLVTFLSTEGAPLVLDLTPDWRVLSVLAALAICTGLAIGILPAIYGSDLQANDALKQARIGSRQGFGRFHMGGLLAATQVALSVLLVAGALLLVRSFEKLKWGDTGFSRDNVLFLALDSDSAGLKPEQLSTYYDTILAGIRTNPSVKSASLSSIVPVSGSYEYDDLQPAAWPNLAASERRLFVHRVAPDYFRTVGLRLLRGRDFRPNDSAPSEQKVILSASAARTYFPKLDPIGRLLHQVEGKDYRVIGIVNDAKFADLREQSPRTVYFKLGGDVFCNAVIRGVLDKSAAVRAMRSLLKQTGRDIRLGDTISITEQIDQTLVTERLLALLASFFGALAAVLAAIGLYGVVGSSAARRTSEMGVRLALGATRQNVLWLILREAIILSVIGVAVGVPVALLAGRLIGSMLYGVKPNDLGTLASTVFLLLTVTAVAGLLPAIRASRLDPMWALRYE